MYYFLFDTNKFSYLVFYLLSLSHSLSLSFSQHQSKMKRERSTVSPLDRFSPPIFVKKFNFLSVLSNLISV